MSPKSRNDAPGTLHPIICCGIERRSVFREGTDRDEFIERLEKDLGDKQHGGRQAELAFVVMWRQNQLILSDSF
jgi:hypothetical protein